MVELLSRPRAFIAAFWLTSMFLSGLLGGLLMDFDSGTMMIWCLLTLLGPALVWFMLLLQGDRTVIRQTELRREVPRSFVSRSRSVARSTRASDPRP